MPIPQANVDQSAMLRNVLVTSWGSCIGLLFGLPPAVGAYELGLPLAYLVAVVVVGLAAGILIAFTAAAFFPDGGLAVERHDTDSPRPASWHPPDEVENRIVWGELLELELQEIAHRGKSRHDPSR
jgi:hypothetical protein